MYFESASEARLLHFYFCTAVSLSFFYTPFTVISHLSSLLLLFYSRPCFFFRILFFQFIHFLSSVPVFPSISSLAFVLPSLSHFAISFCAIALFLLRCWPSCIVVYEFPGFEDAAGSSFSYRRFVCHYRTIVSFLIVNLWHCKSGMKFGTKGSVNLKKEKRREAHIDVLIGNVISNDVILCCRYGSRFSKTEDRDVTMNVGRLG